METETQPQTGSKTLRPRRSPKHEPNALATPEYWDAQYSRSTGDAPVHEWFRSFSELESTFQDVLSGWHGPGGGGSVEDSADGPLILHLGSGDSRINPDRTVGKTIPADLASRGYRRQICVDFSPVVVSIMSARHRKLPFGGGIAWHQADVRDLGAVVADRTVDLAFDKGTLDAMIYGDPWNPPDEVRENARRYTTEVNRVLKDDGTFITVSFRQPLFMKPLLCAGDLWDLNVRVLGGGGCFEYFVYIMKKTRRNSSDPESPAAA